MFMGNPWCARGYGNLKHIVQVIALTTQFPVHYDLSVTSIRNNQTNKVKFSGGELMKKIAIVVGTLFILSGCSLFSGEGGGDASGGGGGNADVQAAIKAAEDALNSANKLGGEWRDSRGKFLKKAKAAASKGDNETALKFAKKAKFQAEAGMAQAKDQASAGPWLF